jgi:hypothetical protein
MTQPVSSSKRKISAILNIIAGVLLLGAGFNILGASPAPSWIWFVFSALFIIVGVWGLFQ